MYNIYKFQLLTTKIGYELLLGTRNFSFSFFPTLSSSAITLSISSLFCSFIFASISFIVFISKEMFNKYIVPLENYLSNPDGTKQMESNIQLLIKLTESHQIVILQSKDYNQ